MYYPAGKPSEDTVSQETGIIVGESHGALEVQTASGIRSARQAVSCLVKPQAGDKVVIAVISRDLAYVLAILEREDRRTTRIEVEGELEVRPGSGRLTLSAAQGISLSSGRDVTLTSPELKIHASAGTVVVRSLSYLGSVVSSELDQVRLMARHCDQVFERFIQKVQRSYRFISESDQVKAERIDYSATKNMNLHARNALLTAELLVKVDGEQIHLG